MMGFIIRGGNLPCPLEKRKVLLENVVGYLTKTEQFLRATRLGKGKLFGHGEVKKKSPAGKPRKNKAYLFGVH